VELFKGAPVPDALLVDGCGRLHPEQNGLACHIAQHLDTLGHKFPVVGVAKNMFWFNGLSVKDDWIYMAGVTDPIAKQVRNGTMRTVRKRFTR